jgi:hypothetical protein
MRELGLLQQAGGESRDVAVGRIVRAAASEAVGLPKVAAVTKQTRTREASVAKAAGTSCFAFIKL